ncbi:hypothetical protein MMC19_007784 [Ptychographa xylographoides]|nr:hypothetical protein [Ptychographa xylographoides]
MQDDPSAVPLAARRTAEARPARRQVIELVQLPPTQSIVERIRSKDVGAIEQLRPVTPGGLQQPYDLQAGIWDLRLIAHQHREGREQRLVGVQRHDWRRRGHPRAHRALRGRKSGMPRFSGSSRSTASFMRRPQRFAARTDRCCGSRRAATSWLPVSQGPVAARMARSPYPAAVTPAKASSQCAACTSWLNWPAISAVSQPMLSRKHEGVRMALFENAQWAVVDWGLTSKNPPAPMEYEILASRLLETGNRGGEECYDWPEQLAEKTWVDTELFLAAYAKALELHVGKYKGSINQEMMDRSVADARKAAAQRRR